MRDRDRRRAYASTEKGLAREIVVSRGRPAPLRPSSPLFSKLPARPRPISGGYLDLAQIAARGARLPPLSLSLSLSFAFSPSLSSRVFSLSFRSPARDPPRPSLAFPLSLSSLCSRSRSRSGSRLPPPRTSLSSVRFRPDSLRPFPPLALSLHLISAFRSARTSRL